MTDWILPADAVAAGLPAPSMPLRVVEAMRHGTMSVELYAPRGADPQQPHRQDELYVILSGTGMFWKAGERRAFGPHDVIFVEAGVAHRFEDFSDDFATWVIFWGPEGGER